MQSPIISTEKDNQLFTTTSSCVDNGPLITLFSVHKLIIASNLLQFLADKQ